MRQQWLDSAKHHPLETAVCVYLERDHIHKYRFPGFLSLVHSEMFFRLMVNSMYVNLFANILMFEDILYKKRQDSWWLHTLDLSYFTGRHFAVSFLSTEMSWNCTDELWTPAVLLLNVFQEMSSVFISYVLLFHSSLTIFWKTNWPVRPNCLRKIGNGETKDVRSSYSQKILLNTMH